MKRLLIVYSTSEGQTAKIAQHMSELARAGLFDVEVCDVARTVPERPLQNYDGVIVGGSIHKGKYAAKLTQFVAQHHDELQTIPSAFFSVCISAAGDEEKRTKAKNYIQNFLDEHDWHPSMSAPFAGAVLYREYGHVRRYVMRKIMSRRGDDTDINKNYEYTDWRQVEDFTAEFLQLLTTEPVAR